MRSDLRGALSPKEATEYLGLIEEDDDRYNVMMGMSGLWELVVSGQLRAARYLGGTRFTRCELDRFLAERTDTPMTDRERDINARTSRSLADRAEDMVPA